MEAHNNNKEEILEYYGKVPCIISKKNLTDNQFNITAKRYIHPPKTFKLFGQPLERWIVW